MNSILMAKHPYDIASLWMNPLVRVVTWIIVTLLSIAGCYILLKLAQPIVGETISAFLFGVALFARWLISMGLATKKLSKYYKTDELFNNKT